MRRQHKRLLQYQDDDPNEGSDKRSGVVTFESCFENLVTKLKWGGEKTQEIKGLNEANGWYLRWGAEEKAPWGWGVEIRSSLRPEIGRSVRCSGGDVSGKAGIWLRAQESGPGQESSVSFPCEYRLKTH